MHFDDLLRDFEDEGLCAKVTVVSSVNEGLHITLESDDWRARSENDAWDARSSRITLSIRCEDAGEATVIPSDVGLITVTRNHPLLWQHTQRRVDLYYSSPPSNEHELLGRLHATHVRLFGRWRSFDAYFHATPEMLRDGYGLLASGPECVIAAYRLVAEPFLRLSSVNSPVQPSTDKLLLLIDEQYVVCRRLSII